MLIRNNIKRWRSGWYLVNIIITIIDYFHSKNQIRPIVVMAYLVVIIIITINYLKTVESITYTGKLEIVEYYTQQVSTMIYLYLYLYFFIYLDMVWVSHLDHE